MQNNHVNVALKFNLSKLIEMPSPKVAEGYRQCWSADTKKTRSRK